MYYCEMSKLSQRFSWGSRSSGKWCCVVEWRAPDVSKERIAFETSGAARWVTMRHFQYTHIFIPL